MVNNVFSRLKPEPKFHHHIKAWRKFRGLSQERLADRVGMSVSSISQLETGKQGYTQATLEALADAMQCEPGDLLMRNPLETEAIWSIWDRLKPVLALAAGRGILRDVLSAAAAGALIGTIVGGVRLILYKR